MIKIIIINGLGGSGKSTFVKYCKEKFEAHKKSMCYELSTVDYPKYVARFCGWDGGKTHMDRVFLHELKEALEHWNDSPTTKVFDDISTLANIENHNYLFFVNIRESYYIEKFLRFAEVKGFKNISTVLVTNPNKESNEVNELVDEIKMVNYDETIVNSGTLEDLETIAEKFVDKVIQEDFNEE